MTNLVNRLRNAYMDIGRHYGYVGSIEEAADEIERLRAALLAIAERENEARECVRSGMHNTTFAIDLASQARLALAGLPVEPSSNATPGATIDGESSALSHQRIHGPGSCRPVAWRYKDSRGHWRYVGNRPNWDFAGEYKSLKPEPLYASDLRTTANP